MIRMIQKARAWHLLLAMVVIPLLLGTVGMTISMIQTFRATCVDTIIDVEALSGGITAALIFTAAPFLFIGLSMVLWMWVIGLTAHPRIAQDRRPSIALFVAAMVFTSLFALALVSTVVSQLAYAPDGTSYINFPLTVVALVSFTYASMFAGKLFEMAESGRDVTADDYFGTALSIWLTPIGVLFLQPRLNKLAERQVAE